MKRIALVLGLALSTCAFAQQAPAPQPADDDNDIFALAQQAPPPGQAPDGPGGQYGRRSPDGPPDMGAPMPPRVPAIWWKDSQVAQELKLTDQQTQQLETTYTSYKLKLIDQRAAVQREATKLEPLVQADTLDEAKVRAQIDALIAARTQLEKTVALMGLDMRKVLSTEQWKQLRQMRPGIGMGMGRMGGAEAPGPQKRQYRGQRRLAPGGRR